MINDYNKKISDIKNNSHYNKTEKLEQLFQLWKEKHSSEDILPKELINYQKKIINSLTIPYQFVDKESFTYDGFIFNENKDTVLYILKESNLGNTNKAKDQFWFKSVYKLEKNTVLILKKIELMQEFIIEKNKGAIKKSDISFMNLNKRGGFTSTNPKILKNYYLKYQEFIKAEIEIIDPKIIVFCMSEKKSKDIQYIINDIKKEFDNKIIISTSHPSYIKGTIENFKKDYYEGILNKRR